MPRSSDAARGQWIVCVRDIAANENSYVGPFHSEDKADAVADRLRRDIDAVHADHILEAFVEWVAPAWISDVGSGAPCVSATLVPQGPRRHRD